MSGDEDAETAIGWLLRDYHRMFDAEYGHWLDVGGAWPARWQDAAGMSDTTVEVTPERLLLLNEELEEVLRRYRDIDVGDPRARRVHVWRFVHPTDADDVPGLDLDTDALDEGPDLGPGSPAPGAGS